MLIGKPGVMVNQKTVSYTHQSNKEKLNDGSDALNANIKQYKGNLVHQKKNESKGRFVIITCFFFVVAVAVCFFLENISLCNISIISHTGRCKPSPVLDVN